MSVYQNQIYRKLPIQIRENKKREAQLEAQEKQTEDEILDNVTISIVVNVLLLVSTILASDFFGIPEFIITRIKEYKSITNTRIESMGVILFYFIGFFFIQLYYSFIYTFRSLTSVFYTVRDVKLDYIKNTFELCKEKNAMTSLVSIAIACCWCLGLYQNSKKKATVKKLFDTRESTHQREKLTLLSETDPTGNS